METILALTACGLTGMAILVARPGGVRWSRVVWIIVPVFGAIGTAAWRNASGQAKSQSELDRALPRRTAESGYVSSAQCRECHQHEYASWHASFHRKMTQPAAPDTVQASFQGEQFKVGDSILKLTRRGDEFWIERQKSAQDGTTGQRILGQQPVVMTTGSHHMQGFWVAHGDGNLLKQVPLMWLVKNEEEPGRWIPIADSFLGRAGHADNTPWNTNCIFCHSVHGAPGIDSRTRQLDTTVAELGIACEACHGPGKTHVVARRAAGPRKQSVAIPAVDDAIVHPGKLDAARSAEVCGHCHSVAKFVDDVLKREWYRTGSRYRPGDELGLTRLTVAPSRLTPDQLQSIKQDPSGYWESQFWPDGMVRVVGREYNGLIESACYARGGMTCISCHSMHHSDPNDQLAARMDTNEACYQCHASFRDDLQGHTHHESGSSGSVCYNCHMPHTTYGLFKAVRSHQIKSPSASASLATGRPNACNLCHLDQTLAWTNQHLAKWYGQERLVLDDDQRNIAAGVLWLLRGDAVQRALVAWSCGWNKAYETSDADHWSPPVLAPLLEDPYSAVRLIAGRSLARMGYARDYDFIAPAERRAAARHSVLAEWTSKTAAMRCGSPARTLIDEPSLVRLLGQRDDRPIGIHE
jgi:predicted CXXCH cytochrome family protein